MEEEEIIDKIKKILDTNINIIYLKDKIRIYKKEIKRIKYKIIEEKEDIYKYISNDELYICCKINKEIKKKIIIYYGNEDNKIEYKIKVKQNEDNDDYNLYNIIKQKYKEIEYKNDNIYYYDDNNNIIINKRIMYLYMYIIILLSIKPEFSYCNNNYYFTKERIRNFYNNDNKDNIISLKINIENENLRLIYNLKQIDNNISNYNKYSYNELLINNIIYTSFYSLRINDYIIDFTLNSNNDIDFKLEFINILFKYFIYIF